MKTIPVIDLARIAGQGGRASDEDLTGTADRIFEVLSTCGFAYLSNHGISQELIDNAFSASKTFFELPEAVKDKSAIDLTQVYNNGYTKPGQELLHTNSTYEVRETYDFSGKGRFYPEDLPELRPALTTLEAAANPLVKNLLRTLAIALKLDDWEISYYPPVRPENVSPGMIRCSEHTDYGTLTLLFQDAIGGLQVKSGGEWIDVTPMPGTIILNTGHLLEIWSGGLFPATVMTKVPINMLLK